MELEVIVMVYPASLLDVIAFELHCEYLSDLRFLSHDQCAVLVYRLAGLPAESVCLKEWNDALNYLTSAPPERTAQTAKDRLICLLSHPASMAD